MLEEPPEQKQNKQQKTSANKKTTLKMTIGVYYLDYSSFKTSESVLNGYMCETGKKRGQKCQKWHAKHLQFLFVCVCPGEMEPIFSTSAAHLCWRDFPGKYWFLPNTEIFNHI